MTRSPFLFHRTFGLDAAVLAVTASVLASAALPQALPQPGSPEAALDVFERRLSAASGQVIPLALSGTDHKVVFYAPFSILWLLDETGGAVEATARLTRTRDQLNLDRGDTVQLVDLTAPGKSTTGSATPGAQHPIAAFHDRLLAQPLARPVAGLAAGSRFLAWNSTNGGIVQPPESDAARITGPVLWRSLGDHIVIQHGSGQSETLRWTLVDKALKGRDG